MHVALRGMHWGERWRQPCSSASLASCAARGASSEPWHTYLPQLVCLIAHDCSRWQVGELGVVLMVGGNIAGETRTASIAVYDAVQAFDDGTAARMSLILLAFSAIVLIATYALRRAPLSVWSRA